MIPGPIGARCVTVDHLQLDQGSVNHPGRARTVGWSSCKLAESRKPVVGGKLQASSHKLDRYSIKDYIGCYESKRSKKNN